MLAAAAVFVLAYALLSFPMAARAARRFAERHMGTGRLVSRAFGLPGIALAGGMLMVAVGAVAPREAFAAVDLHVLALLFGMMALVAALDLANVLEVLAAAVARAARTPRGLLVATALVTAALSALVLNDAVVLLFTPVLVRACRAKGLPVMPYLAVEAVAANIGSVATPVGNPQNALIAIAGHVDYVVWFRVLVLPTVLSLGLAIAWGLVFFRRDLGAGTPSGRPQDPEGRRGTETRLRASTRDGAGPGITNVRLAIAALAAVATALVGFVMGPQLGIALDGVAFLCGAAVVVVAPFARVRPQDVLKRVDLGVLVFFAGLFVLVAGVRSSGLLAVLYGVLPFDVASVTGLTVVTTVLSNLVSNVPAVLLLLPAAEGLATLLLLAAVSTLAGNATFLGAAANVIVAESARKEGARFEVARFVLYGLPLALVTILLAAWLVPLLA